MESSYLLKTQSFNSTPLELIVKDLNSNFSKFFKKSPEIELRNSWTKSSGKENDDVRIENPEIRW